MDARDLDMLGMNLAEVGMESTNIVKNCNDKSSGSDDYSYKSAEVGTDCISRAEAIDALEQDPMGGLNYERILGSLPSAQAELCEYYALCRHGRDENKLRSVLGCCDYCNEDSDGYVKPLEKNGHAFVRFGMDGWELSLKANGWHGSAKIRYCPMCGRDLLVKFGKPFFTARGGRQRGDADEIDRR